MAGEDRLASLDDLRACVTLDGPQEPKPVWRYVIGVDLGLKNDRTAVAVCHAERASGDEESPLVGGRVVLDRLQVWQGSRLRPVQLDDVENWVAEAAARYYPAQVVLDPWQSAGLSQRLMARGVRAEDFNFSAQSVGRLASTLLLLVRNRALALPDDAELIDELANLRLRESSPGVYRIDHDPDRHDDRAIALALAAQMLVGDTWGRPERPARTEWASTRDRVIEELWERETGEIDRADRRRGVDRSGWSV